MAPELNWHYFDTVQAMVAMVAMAMVIVMMIVVETVVVMVNAMAPTMALALVNCKWARSLGDLLA